ncbi:hypothetical protein PLESTM_001454600 [Pleodorina starrii]|nr:hypothetical protein PLESTM_001454600 [Pleodorina starrii]
MGKGRALTVTDDGQVPRLTTLLRVLVADQAGSAAAPYHRLDVDALTVARGSVLEEKRRRAAGAAGAAGGPPGFGAAGSKAGLGGGSGARSGAAAAEGSLLSELFGDCPEKAPRAARDDYDKFLKAVSSAVEGEHSSTDLRELASAVWRTWAPLEPPDTSRGRGMQQAIKPHREALAAVLGPVLRDTSLPGLWEAVTALKAWREKLAGPAAPAASSSPGAAAAGKQPGGGKAAASAAAGGGGGSGGLQREEFGADLEFHFSDAAMSADQALDRMCGRAGGGGGGGGLPYGGGGYSSEPSPAELRQMMAAATGGGGGGGGGDDAAAAPYSMYDDDGDDDETLDRKKLRDAGVVWLYRWCERMVGPGNPDEAASTATAVGAVLLGGGSGDEMAAQLYDLLGDAAFDGLNELMENRKSIGRFLSAAIARYKELYGGPPVLAGLGAGGGGPGGGGGGGPAMPSYAPGVTVNSTSQKLLAKLQRKDAKKARDRGRDT